MRLSDLANIASILQGIFVIVSICYLWYQLRENTRLARAANTQALVALSSPFYLQLVQDQELSKLWQQGSVAWDAMNESDKFRFRDLALWWLIFHENIYYQWKKKLIDNQTYNTWARDFEKLLAAPSLKHFWEDLLSTTSFEASFNDHLHQLMRKYETPKRIVCNGKRGKAESSFWTES